MSYVCDLCYPSDSNLLYCIKCVTVPNRQDSSGEPLEIICNKCISKMCKTYDMVLCKNINIHNISVVFNILNRYGVPIDVQDIIMKYYMW